MDGCVAAAVAVAEAEAVAVAVAVAVPSLSAQFTYSRRFENVENHRFSRFSSLLPGQRKEMKNERGESKHEGKGGWEGGQKPDHAPDRGE